MSCYWIISGVHVFLIKWLISVFWSLIFTINTSVIRVGIFFNGGLIIILILFLNGYFSLFLIASLSLFISLSAPVRSLLSLAVCLAALWSSQMLCCSLLALIHSCGELCTQLNVSPSYYARLHLIDSHTSPWTAHWLRTALMTSCSLAQVRSRDVCLCGVYWNLLVLLVSL